MHKNQFGRKFVIPISCIIFCNPGLAKIQVRPCRPGEIVFQLSIKRVHIARIVISISIDNVRHIPAEITADKDGTLIKMPAVGQIESDGLIIIFCLCENSLVGVISSPFRVRRYFCFALTGGHISLMIVKIRFQIILIIMKPRHVFAGLVNHILAGLPFILSVASVITVYIVAVVLRVRMGKIKTISDIVTPVYIIMLSTDDIVIHPCRTAAVRMGNMIYFPHVVIGISNPEFIPCLRADCIVLLSIVAKARFYLGIPCTFGDDINNTTAGF